MITSSIERDVRERLTEHGVRYTRGRHQVIDALAEAHGPRSAAELHLQIGEAVPLSSLYRTLSVLEAAGVLSPHHGDRDVTRYELAEWLTGHHHHLVCRTCGAVADVDFDAVSESAVHDVVARVSGAAGFTASGHNLEIEGVCARCT